MAGPDPESGKAANRKYSRLRVVIAEQKPGYAFNVGAERLLAAQRRHAGLAIELEAIFVDDADAFAQAIVDAHAVIGWRFAAERVIPAARQLAWVHLTGVGAEHMLPLDWLPSGAVLTNSRGAQVRKAREVATMALLMLQNQVPAFVTAQKQRRWDQRLTAPVAGEHVVVVGMGATGSAVAEAANALGMRVTGVRRSREASPFAHWLAGVEALPQLLVTADIVVLALPATDATRNLFDDAMLAHLRPHAGLINMGRAAVIDLAALARRLDAGQIGSAVLDSYPEEPLPEASRLWDTRNLIVLPHITSGAAGSFLDASLDVFFDNAQRFLCGLPFINVVEAHRGY